MDSVLEVCFRSTKHTVRVLGRIEDSDWIWILDDNGDADDAGDNK